MFNDEITGNINAATVSLREIAVDVGIDDFNGSIFGNVQIDSSAVAEGRVIAKRGAANDQAADNTQAGCKREGAPIAGSGDIVAKLAIKYS